MRSILAYLDIFGVHVRKRLVTKKLAIKHSIPYLCDRPDLPQDCPSGNGVWEVVSLSQFSLVKLLWFVARRKTSGASSHFLTDYSFLFQCASVFWGTTRWWTQVNSGVTKKLHSAGTIKDQNYYYNAPFLSLHFMMNSVIDKTSSFIEKLGL